jgi:hypothetical protein
MSIGASMESAWHNHPYIIMGVGGLIVLYFLWPSSSAPSSSGSSDYANQLAAETALSQSQLAEQAQSVQGQQQATAAEDAAAFQSVAGSNEAIAAANAASLIAENQTNQAGIAAEGANAIAQTQANSTDFTSLIAGLTAFGAQTTDQGKNANQTGLDAYLAGLGSKFSNNNGDLAVSEGAQPESAFYTSQGTGASGGGSSPPFGVGWMQNNWAQWGNQGQTNNKLAATLGTDVASASTPFTHSQDILAALWSSMVKTNADIQAKPVVTLPPIQFAPSTLAGQIQPLPAISAVP